MKLPTPAKRSADAPLFALAVEDGAKPVEVEAVVAEVVGKATEGADEVTVVVALLEVAFPAGAVHPSTLKLTHDVL